MSETSLVEREAAALHTLERLAAERARAESETEQGYRIRVETEERGFQQALGKLTKAAEAEIATTEARYKSLLGELQSKFQVERQAAEREYAAVKSKTAAQTKTALKAAKREHEETRWQLLAVFEAAKDSAVKQNKQREADLAAAAELLQTIKDEANRSLEPCRRFFPPSAPGEPASEPAAQVADDPFPTLQALLVQAEEQLVPLVKLSLPRFLKLQQFVWPFLVLGLAAAYPAGVALGWKIGPTVDAAVVVATALGFWFWLASIARRQVGRLYPPFCKSLAEADLLALRCQQWVKASFEGAKAVIEQRREADTRAVDERLALATAEFEQRREQETRQADEKYPALLREIERRRTESLQQIDERYPRRLSELKERL
jgi:hypothetical protein